MKTIQVLVLALFAALLITLTNGATVAHRKQRSLARRDDMPPSDGDMPPPDNGDMPTNPMPPWWNKPMSEGDMSPPPDNGAMPMDPMPTDPMPMPPWWNKPMNEGEMFPPYNGPMPTDPMPTDPMPTDPMPMPPWMNPMDIEEDSVLEAHNGNRNCAKRAKDNYNRCWQKTHNKDWCQKQWQWEINQCRMH